MKIWFIIARRMERMRRSVPSLLFKCGKYRMEP